MAATMTTAILAEKDILQILPLKDRDFHKRSYMKLFTSKWWLSSKIEAWNFTKNKLSKFVNSTKMD